MTDKAHASHLKQQGKLATAPSVSRNRKLSAFAKAILSANDPKADRMSEPDKKALLRALSKR